MGTHIVFLLLSSQAASLIVVNEHEHLSALLNINCTLRGVLPCIVAIFLYNYNDNNNNKHIKRAMINRGVQRQLLNSAHVSVAISLN